MYTSTDTIKTLLELQKKNSFAKSELQGLEAHKNALLSSVNLTNKEAWEKMFLDLESIAPALTRHAYYIDTGISVIDERFELHYVTDRVPYLKVLIGVQDTGFCLIKDEPFAFAWRGYPSATHQRADGVRRLQNYTEDFIRFVLGDWDKCFRKICEDLLKLETEYGTSLNAKIEQTENMISLLSKGEKDETENERPGEEAVREE